MLENRIKLNNENNSVCEFLDCIRQGVPSAVFGVNDSFKSYLISQIEDQVLFVAKDNISAFNVEKVLKEFTDKNVVFLPAKDEILLASLACSKIITYNRLSAFSKIKNADIIITTPDAIIQRFYYVDEVLSLKKGQNINRDKVISTLIKMGYTSFDGVENKGQFAVRGDIVDVFSVDSENPVRISFFGDEIESIYSFDVESRKKLSSFNVYFINVAEECVFSEKDYQKLLDAVQSEIEKSNKENRENLYKLKDDIVDNYSKHDFGYFSNFSSVKEDFSDISSVLNDNCVVVFDEAKRVSEYIDLYLREFEDRYNSLLKVGSVLSIEKNNVLSFEELKKCLKRFKLTAFQTITANLSFFNPLKIIKPNVGNVVDYRLDFNVLYSDIDNWLKCGYNVKIYTGDIKRAEKLCFDLSSRGIASSINGKNSVIGVEIHTLEVECSFIYHETKTVIIGTNSLYSKRTNNIKVIKKQSFFSAPESGDYCVHETHGLGKVLGSKKITTTEGTKDYIAVEYYGGDILYVPVEQMDILTRYLGSDKNPKLSKIGGKDFERVKNNVRESIKKMSFDLKRLYSERNSLKGFKFIDDEELQSVFDNSFPFEMTADQFTCINEIKNDMTSGKVMDRLICGDVGFGKTEVAFRAIFRAVANSKQAVLLAPTTILTEQHYNTAIERFKDFGIKIEVINRFKTPKQQANILERLKKGEIDFIIGTHRLLSKDVEFKDLGLLVLDEEQRFGVEHKEKIKLLKKNVDTLSLSATPIPRTLNMSLTGIREISTINTPPKMRLPVQVYVTEETDAIIKDAVLREINRGGQVFILYNRVESINTFANKIQLMLPNVKIQVVHGQMEERTLEKGILKFYNGEANVLIATTIIENGIDLPNANTLIVIDADNLGLSTLYQLKGRVGRSDRLAYSYFMFKKDKVLSENAYERLEAIMQFAEMGSGIKVAMRDLEIRGAGNVLGAEQHGHMDKIGYELYSKLLKEELTGEEEIVPELDVRVSAYIPENYIQSSSARMSAYKEIAEIDSLENEKETKDFLISTYGELPIETANLIDIAMLKRFAGKFGVREINILKDKTNFVFNSLKYFDNENLIKAIDECKGTVYISASGKPSLEFIRKDRENVEMLITMRSFAEKVAFKKKQ